MTDEEMIKGIAFAMKKLNVYGCLNAIGGLGCVITELKSRQNTKPEMSKGEELHDLRQDIQANKDRIKALELALYNCHVIKNEPSIFHHVRGSNKINLNQ